MKNFIMKGKNAGLTLNVTSFSIENSFSIEVLKGKVDVYQCFYLFGYIH